MTSINPIGLIAGNRELPLIVARAIKEKGLPLVVCGLRGETDPKIQNLADRYLISNLGQLGAIVEYFQESGVKTLTMAGGISRKNILEHYDPDSAAIALMETVPNFQTDTILRAFARFLEENGFTLISATDLAPALLVSPGQLGAHTPSPGLSADLALAFTLARELGRLDIGQTVVVSDLIAVALEGADGTDATIRRGASLSKRPIAVAKVLKPTQDTRLDLPVIGPPTIELLAELKAGGLALDAKGLIILERERCVAIADEAKIALLAWLNPPLPPEKTPLPQIKSKAKKSDDQK